VSSLGNPINSPTTILPSRPGIPVARHPPHRSVRKSITSYGSYLGSNARRTCVQSVVHQSVRSTRLSGSVSGAPPGPTATHLLRRSRFCHPFGATKAATGNRFSRSSIAWLALLCQRFGQPLTRTRRMTRGRGGWLALPRTALLSAVSCRFIPTLSVPPLIE